MAADTTAPPAHVVTPPPHVVTRSHTHARVYLGARNAECRPAPLSECLLAVEKDEPQAGESSWVLLLHHPQRDGLGHFEQDACSPPSHPSHHSPITTYTPRAHTHTHILAHNRGWHSGARRWREVEGGRGEVCGGWTYRQVRQSLSPPQTQCC